MFGGFVLGWGVFNYFPSYSRSCVKCCRSQTLKSWKTTWRSDQLNWNKTLFIYSKINLLCFLLCRHFFIKLGCRKGNRFAGTDRTRQKKWLELPRETNKDPGFALESKCITQPRLLGSWMIGCEKSSNETSCPRLRWPKEALLWVRNFRKEGLERTCRSKPGSNYPKMLGFVKMLLYCTETFRNHSTC